MKAGWQVKPLGELCDILDNQRKPITKSLRTQGNYPYYGATGILDYVAGVLFDEPLVLVGEDGAKWASGENTAFSVNEKCWVNNHAHVLRPLRNKIIDKWLINYLVHSDLSEFVSGLTVPKLNQGNLRVIPIPIPSVHEQLRIVAILDQAFEGIAKARANAEKNRQNARALFESHLQSIFTQRGEGWMEKPLSEVCEIKPPKSEAKKLLKNSDFVSFAPMEDLGINQKYLNPKKQRALEDVAGSYTYFAEGDVLLAKITPCFENGKLGIAKNLINGIGFGSSEYIVFRPNKELSNEFLYYFLSRKRFIEEGAVRMSGAVGHKRVSKEFIEGYKIAFPLLSTQKEIVNKIDDLSKETQRLEALYQRKITLLDELRKSLLQQAFAGAL